MGWTARGSNPDKGKRVFYSLEHPYELWDTLSLLLGVLCLR